MKYIGVWENYFFFYLMIQYIRCHGNLELSFSQIFLESQIPPSQIWPVYLVGQLVCQFVNQMMSYKISPVDLRSNRCNSEAVHISFLSSVDSKKLI